MRYHQLYLAIPTLFFLLCDFAITLAGQPSEYWAGDYSHTNEGAPFWRMMLEGGPFMFCVAGIFWMILILTVCLLTPRLLTIWVTSCLTFGHYLGLSSWLLFKFKVYYQALMLLPLLAGTLVLIAWALFYRSIKHGAVEEWKFPATIRWSIAGTAVAIGLVITYMPGASA